MDNKWSQFSTADLRSFQNLISNHIENVRSDCVTEDGEILSSSLDADKAEELNAETIYFEAELRRILAELERRMT